jgi:hypothetical protein
MRPGLRWRKYLRERKGKGESGTMESFIVLMWIMGIGWGKLLSIWEFIIPASASLSDELKISVAGGQECNIAGHPGLFGLIFIAKYFSVKNPLFLLDN